MSDAQRHGMHEPDEPWTRPILLVSAGFVLSVLVALAVVAAMFAMIGPSAPPAPEAPAVHELSAPRLQIDPSEELARKRDGWRQRLGDIERAMRIIAARGERAYQPVDSAPEDTP